MPLFVVHSAGDGLIPVEHAKMFAAAHPEAKIWILQDQEHVEAFAHPDYEERLRSFLKESRKEAR